MTEPVQMETVRRAARGAGCAAHEGQQALVFHRRARAVAAGHHEGVECGEFRGCEILHRAIDAENDTAGGRNGTVLLGDKLDLVGGGASGRIDGGGEDLHGPGNVEHLRRVIDEHHHATGRGAEL